MEAMWGTWEELLLGGAVLRHGAAAWDAVAAELRRRRTPSSPAERFTPQECEAKYEDLQERYSGCEAWFEELRKQRVAELRRELEKADDSIGSLQSKLESLSTERENNSSFDYNTSRTESPSPTENAEGIDSSSKEVSRDESSAGSYMGDAERDWSQEYQISASVSSHENERKVDPHENGGTGTCGGVSDITQQRIFKKKRGQRKRKSCSIVKEGSVGESSMVDVDRKDPAPQEDTGEPNEDSGGRVQCKHSSSVLTSIMDSIMEHKDVSIFGRRLESQKRARYKKMIRRHVDLCNISLRISNGSISAAKELFRDLLLLATNAIVFYPKNSPEHKSALMLRRLVTKALREHEHEHSCTPISNDDGGVVPIQEESAPVKPQSLQACNRKMLESVVVSGKVAGPPVSEDGKRKGGRHEPPAESLARKRVVGGRAAKRGGCVGGKRGQESSDRGRKRARRGR